ncbi:MAG: hypothetical protein L3J37_05280 [Rhodobacteraceae bacterium]|nr:hypothetical protein [Paracoccaceae bacterium]
MTGDVEIVNVEASPWRFDVTLRRLDTGRDHYADGWTAKPYAFYLP